MLKQLPPESVVQALRAHHVHPAQIRLSAETDIDLAGHYRSHWLVTTDDRLFVVTGPEAVDVQLVLNLDDISEVRTQAVVGSGLLQVCEHGVMIDVLRFSNRLAGRFNTAARLVDRQRRGDACDEASESLPPSSDRGEIGRGAALLRMLKLTLAYRRAATLMMLILFAGIVLDLVSPQLTRILVDQVLPGSHAEVEQLRVEPDRFAEQMRLLLLVVGALVGIQIVRAALNVANGMLTSRVGAAMTFDIRRRLVAHLERLSISYYDKQNVGALVGRVAYDTEALHGFVSQLTSGFLFQILLVVGVGVMMFSMNPTLATWTLLPAPLVIAGSTVFWRYIYPRYYRLWDASSKQAGMLSGMLTGIRVVKAFGQEQREADRFNRISDSLRSSRVNLENASSVFNPIMSVVFQLGGWLVWFIGGRGVLEGSMTLGELMAFFGYLWMFYGPLGSLTQFTNWLTQFVTQTHRIFEVLDAPIAVNEPDNPVPVGEIQGDVTFDHVSFGYHRHQPVLQDVSFTIRRGEMIGVVGRSGSGKSTLVNLLCRFYDADQGSVRIDGIDVRQLSQQTLRQQIGIVLQEPFLFHGSIWDNITYGRPALESAGCDGGSHASAATPEAVIAAAKAANCHDFIMHHPHGYDTWVGERGAGLSGGERQRISIARVLLTDPRILILDEATSSVDTESESAIQAGIAELVRDRTTIAIAHRLSTLRHATRILVLDRGRIIESGTHEELLAFDGLYAQLIRLQGHADTFDDEAITLAASASRATVSQRTQSGSVAVSTASVQEVWQGGKLRGAGEAHAAHRPRWLTPDSATIGTGKRNTLRVTVHGERSWDGVYVLRCLPVHYPEGYLSLRCLDEDKREVEVGLIRSLSDWPAIPQELVRHALAKRYFVHTIRAIHDVRSVNGLLRFDVETDLGPLQFSMRPDNDRAQDYGRSGRILLDLDDNHFLVPDVNALPPADRRRFRRHIYW